MLLIWAFYARFRAQCLQDYHRIVSNSVVASLYIYNIEKNCQIVTLISNKTKKKTKNAQNRATMLNSGPYRSRIPSFFAIFEPTNGFLG